MSTDAMPCVFVNHGGGPMPLLGQQPRIADFLRRYAATLPRRPKAVLVATAHWEEAVVTVSTGASPSLLFDYGGFPPESYRYKYPAPGAPELAAQVLRLLEGAGITAKADSSRGWDHGVFVPMMLMFPEADVPILQMSLLRSQNAEEHIRIGAALQTLREDDVLIVGSGYSFHNFKYVFASGSTRSTGLRHAAAFDAWLRQQLLEAASSPEARLKALAGWEAAPSAKESQPEGRAEHLVPLFVVAGAAGGRQAICVGDLQEEDPDDFKISNFEFH